MWKLWNKLFGWDYVVWSNTADQGIARVHVDGLGRAYCWRYSGVAICDVIQKPKDVIWLTCHPAKYLPHSSIWVAERKRP